MREVHFKSCKLNLKLESRMRIQNFPLQCQIQNFDVKLKTSMLDILVIVLTRAVPALQYHFLLFLFFFELGLLFPVLLFFYYVVTELRLSTLVLVILDLKILQVFKM